MVSTKNFEVVANPEQVKRVGRVFDAVELHKSRRRLLYWPRQLNQELADSQFAELLHTVGLVDASVHARTLVPKEWAVTFDLRKSFYQVPLSKDVRPYFAYVVRGQHYQHARMPMGANFAPSVMHAITTVIADVRVPGARVETYIDNVRFHGTRNAVLQAARRFRDRASAVGATLNDEEQNHSSSARNFPWRRHQLRYSRSLLGGKDDGTTARGTTTPTETRGDGRGCPGPLWRHSVWGARATNTNGALLPHYEVRAAKAG